MWLTDSAARDHQPHHATLTDEVRKLRAESRDSYIRALTSAWRTPSRDAAEPDLGSRPEELRRRRRSAEFDPNAASERERERRIATAEDLSELARDLEKRRAAIRAERDDNLSNAWKTCPARNNCSRGEGEAGGVPTNREFRLAHH
jgi:hypothetical protein